MKHVDEDKIMTKVLDTLHHQGIASMSHAERAAYLSAVMHVSYQLMRSVEGDEFVRGFLESALADLNRPAPIGLRLPS
jgi:hypothetical protein